jgi:rRNA maturation endonuclease Nob1
MLTSKGGISTMLLGKCKGCGKLYDVDKHEDCPNCGRYSGSQLDSVRLIKATDPEYQDFLKELEDEQNI